LEVCGQPPANLHACSEDGLKELMGDAQQLRAQFRERCARVDTLEAECAKVREAAAALRNHLSSIQVEDGQKLSESVVPEHFNAGWKPGDVIRPLKDLLSWLAATVDIIREAVFNVDGEVGIGGRNVHLGRMVNWPLKGSGGQQLSVPYELRTEVAHVLADMHARGGASEFDAEQLRERWDMVSGKVSTSGDAAPVPAIFLVNSKTSQAMVVAAWPSLNHRSLCPPSPTFDADKHFGRVAQLPSSECAAGTSGCWCEGDRVEVRWGGQWYAGVLQRIAEGSIAHVQCDADMPGLITVAPVVDIRLTQLVASPLDLPLKGERSSSTDTVLADEGSTSVTPSESESKSGLLERSGGAVGG